LTLASLETLCGLELHKRTSLPCVPDLLAERVDLLEGEDAVIAARVRDVLMPALANRMKLRLPQLVSQTWRALGGAACVDAEQLANVNAFLRLLDDLDRQNISIDASTLDDAMGRLCAPPDPDASDQIQVMTIHKAKGLTFDVVIVPGMDKTAANDRPALLEWIEDDASPEPNLLLSPMASVGDDKSPLTKWIAAAKRKRADAELRRMFYVAATRAREYVHFFAAVEDHDGKLRKPRSNSLLSVAWKAVEGVAHKQLKAVPELLPAMAAEAEAVPSAQNLIRRLPKDWHPDRSAQMPIGSNAGDISSIAGASSTQDQDEIEERGDSVTIAASIAGRAVGTLVHSLLEQAAERIAGGESISATTSWVESRSRNIQNSLRMLGVPKAALERSNRSVLGLVRNALNSTTGRWVLAAHPEASNELRISVAATAEETQHRLDRVFLAGPEPLAPGNSHVWIVDYKTTSHAQQGLEEFLQARQQIYDPTIHAYAVALRALRNDRLPIICALYYMALDRLEIVARLDP
jgi:ATP-dependent exoDNAse (exonuclease V) beta subunit